MVITFVLERSQNCITSSNELRDFTHKDLYDIVKQGQSIDWYSNKKEINQK